MVTVVALVLLDLTVALETVDQQFLQSRLEKCVGTEGVVLDCLDPLCQRDVFVQHLYMWGDSRLYSWSSSLLYLLPRDRFSEDMTSRSTFMQMTIKFMCPWSIFPFLLSISLCVLERSRHGCPWTSAPEWLKTCKNNDLRPSTQHLTEGRV